MGKHNMARYIMRKPLLSSLIDPLMLSGGTSNPLISPQINWAVNRTLEYTESVKDNTTHGFMKPVILISISMPILYLEYLRRLSWL